MDAHAVAFTPASELVEVFIECRDEVQEILLDTSDRYVAGATPAYKKFVLTQFLNALSHRYEEEMLTRLGLRPYGRAKWGPHTYVQWQFETTLILLRSLRRARIACPTSGLKYSAGRVGREAQAISSAQVPLVRGVNMVMIVGLDIEAVCGERAMDPPRRLDIGSMVIGAPLTFTGGRVNQWAHGSGVVEIGSSIFQKSEPQHRGQQYRML